MTMPSPTTDPVIAALEAHDAAMATMKDHLTHETGRAAAEAWAALETTARAAGWREGEVGYLTPFEPVKEFALRRKVAALQARVEELTYAQGEAVGFMQAACDRAAAAEAALEEAMGALEPFARLDALILPVGRDDQPIPYALSNRDLHALTVAQFRRAAEVVAKGGRETAPDKLGGGR